MSRGYREKREMLRKIANGERVTHTCWCCGEDFPVTMESITFHAWLCIACTYEVYERYDLESQIDQLRVTSCGPYPSQSRVPSTERVP
jgi:ribosomal protein L37AE/L43A